MTETARTPSAPERHSARFPLLLTAALLLIIISCFWYLWLNNRSQYAEEYARLGQLEQRKEELANLLSLTPCEARARLRPAPVSESDASSTSVSEARTSIESVKASTGGPDAVERACVFIVAPGGKRTVSTGSGFFVAPGYVVTNRHVVGDSKGKVLVTSKGLGEPVRGEVVALSSGKNTDFAIVRVQTPPNARVATLPLSGGVQKTEKVGAWGYPDLVGKNDPAYARLLRGEDISAIPELSYTEGVVSAVLPRNPEIIVHTAPISPGNSGGPLLNGKGEVVGINTMITLDEGSYRQASLALSAADIQKFLASHGIRY